MGKIFIVHFQPLERYPPVMNFIKYLVEKNVKKINLQVITTEGDGCKKLFGEQGVVIHRIGKLHHSWNRTQRLFFYWKFNSKCLVLLKKHYPEKVVYYETISSGPPCLYKRWFNNNCQIFAHYHEYVSKEEYNSGMFLTKWLHKFELMLFPQFEWISHTNTQRAELFLQDIGLPNLKQIHIMPNYPPRQWMLRVGDTSQMRVEEPVRFVYVGALSLGTMYLAEFAAYVKQQPDRLRWDIFSDNFDQSVMDFFKDLKASNISFHGSLEYDQIPEKLVNFDVGVILYKGHIPNYVFNAPNKLFEYLICGLNVWFPKEMLGCNAYISNGAYPEVISVDFGRLTSIGIVPKRKYPGINNKNSYTCDTAFSEIGNKLLAK